MSPAAAGVVNGYSSAGAGGLLGSGISQDQATKLMIQGGKQMMQPQQQGQQMPPPMMPQSQRPPPRSMMINAQGQPMQQLRPSRLF
jgi:hypothetical protein